MTTFTLRKLPFDAICVEGDCNFPKRAEAAGHLDVDGDMPSVCRAAGVQAGDIVVDVGAFVGDTASVFAQHGAQVYAFEPFLDAFVCLLYNTRKLNVECFNVPVGNGERVQFVYECPGPNYGMRHVREALDSSCIVTTKIDSLALPACKLMKIDCEGAEIPTLLGARKTIEKYRPLLFVEMFEGGLKQRGYTPAQLEETIRGLGYSLEMWGEAPRWDWFCRPL